MALKVYSAIEAITVEHPLIVVISDPGIGKTTLGYMTRDPLMLDFDEGAYRSRNRKEPTVQVEAWADVLDLLDNRQDLFDRAQTYVEDTVGRRIELMEAYVTSQAKYVQSDGTLNTKGWGRLLDISHSYMTKLRAKRKDVLLLCHGKEKDDGGVTKVRPDIRGGTRDEILKDADLIGYLRMDGKRRVLDFNPTEGHFGKNPAQWPVLEVPDFTKEPTWMSTLFDRAREALGKISAESADVAAKVAEWQGKIEASDSPEALTALVPALSALEPPMLKAQARELVSRKAKAQGWKWDAASSKYAGEKPTAPAPAVTSAPVSEPPAEMVMSAGAQRSFE